MPGLEPLVPNTPRHTDGTWLHTGRLIVNQNLELRSSSATVTITVADWNALLARVAALEARGTIDSLEDLKYGN